MWLAIILVKEGVSQHVFSGPAGLNNVRAEQLLRQVPL